MRLELVESVGCFQCSYLFLPIVSEAVLHQTLIMVSPFSFNDI